MRSAASSFSMTNRPLPPATDVELDIRALLMSLVRALPYLIVLVGIVAIGTFVLLSRVAPIFKSEATVLIQSGESSLTRTSDTPAEPGLVLDDQAIASQVQLIRSRDLARKVATKLDLQSRPEYQTGDRRRLAAHRSPRPLRARPQSGRLLGRGARARPLLSAAAGVDGREIPRHRHRLLVDRSEARRRCRQCDRQRVHRPAAHGQARYHGGCDQVPRVRDQ